MTLNEVPIDPAATYRVTVSNFLANGGDTFSAFTKGRERTLGPSDIAAFEAWLKLQPPRAAPIEARTIDLKPQLNQTRSTAPPGVKYH